MQRFFSVKISDTELWKFRLFSKSCSPVLYQESEKWYHVFFDCFTIFVTKRVGLPISVIFFSEAKFLQENYCFNKSSTTQSQTSSSMMHNHKSQRNTCPHFRSMFCAQSNIKCLCKHGSLDALFLRYGPLDFYYGAILKVLCMLWQFVM
jgi:hypothetical protein